MYPGTGGEIGMGWAKADHSYRDALLPEEYTARNRLWMDVVPSIFNDFCTKTRQCTVEC